MTEKNPFDYNSMVAAFTELSDSVIKAFETMPLNALHHRQQDMYLESLMHSNDRAADKRRKWRVKPSTVR